MTFLFGVNYSQGLTASHDLQNTLRNVYRNCDSVGPMIDSFTVRVKCTREPVSGCRRNKQNGGGFF